MAEPDIVLDIWGIDELLHSEVVNQLHQTTEDTFYAHDFREARLYIDDSGSLHTKAERIHSTDIATSPYYDALRLGGLSLCMDLISTLYVADGGTLAEWVSMTLAERCEWIQDYTP